MKRLRKKKAVFYVMKHFKEKSQTYERVSCINHAYFFNAQNKNIYLLKNSFLF